MIRIMFLLLLLALSSRLAAMEIQTQVDRSPVNIDESFSVTFIAEESPDGEPDFSILEQDFEILNQSKSSQSSWINGKASKSIQWHLSLMAKHSGEQVIPPVQFGDDLSEPVKLMVTGNNHSNNSAVNGDLYLEVEATPESPYVQSQVLYTIRVYGRVEISQASLNEPELKDAVIEKLGDEDSHYNTQINGVDYWVIERKYAIFPQKSGQLTIKPLTLNAQIIASGQPLFNGFFNSHRAQAKRLSSQAVTLDVKPVPAGFTGKHWLAAEALDLKQEWSGDFQQMKTGEPLTRTLTLSAKSITVGQLPELSQATAIDGLKTYPDQPVLHEQKNAEGVAAVRQEKIAMIASKSGSYTLPAIEIPWFNTKTNTMEVARLPELTLDATAGEAADAPAPQAGISAQSSNPAGEAAAQISTINADTGNGDAFWPWLSGGLAFGWLATVVYFAMRRPQTAPAITSKPAPETSYKDISKQLKHACQANDAVLAKNLLLEWGKTGFQAASLGAIASRVDARLRDEILALEQSLYSAGGGTWQGKKLLQAFSEQTARAKIGKPGDTVLEPLHRL